MDNQASSNIVNQDSSIEATEVETLPPLPTTQASEPPTKANLGSHLKDMSWRDGVDILADAADFIPGLGSFIKASVGTGDYSPDARLKEKQFKWAVEEIAKISHKIDILIQKLPPDEQIEAADVAAIINAAMKASEKTADAKKRKLLKNAVVNAFDIEQYQAGMTLRLFKILENVEYGDVIILRKIVEIAGYQSNSIVMFRDFIGQGDNSNKKDIRFYHLEILYNQKLILVWNTSFPLGLEEARGCMQLTEIGEKFLEFIKEPE